MTREKWIEGLSEYCKREGKELTDEKLKTANLVYDAIELLMSGGLSEKEAWEKYAWVGERISSGDVEIGLINAREGSEMLDSLDRMEAELPTDDPEIQEELDSLRSDVQAVIDNGLQLAHDVAAIGIHAPRRLGQK